MLGGRIRRHKNEHEEFLWWQAILVQGAPKVAVDLRATKPVRASIQSL